MPGAYLDKKFTEHINSKNIDIIFEVGSRELDDTIKLSNYYKRSNIFSYECNPLTIDLCKENLSKCVNKTRIVFCPYALSSHISEKIFYPFIYQNWYGCSSFYKRVDYNKTQIKSVHKIRCSTIDNEIKKYGIHKIDLLCLDTQGSELDILYGAKNYIHKIHYIILESPIEDNKHYIGAASYNEISLFLERYNFKEKVKIRENDHENNILFENMNFSF